MWMRCVHSLARIQKSWRGFPMRFWLFDSNMLIQEFENVVFPEIDSRVDEIVPIIR
jgi:hypothetical protein